MITSNSEGSNQNLATGDVSFDDNMVRGKDGAFESKYS